MALSCRKSQGRWSRHGAANDIIARALLTAGVPTLKEPPGCSNTDGKRPDGLTLIPWKKGKSLIWDLTCTDTFVHSYLESTSTAPGKAAKQAEDKKYKKYDDLTPQFFFFPVAIETS